MTLTAGPQAVTAYLVAEGGTTVRTAYAPDVDLATPCVRAGQVTTVHVSYTPIATSGKLWLGASNTPSTATLLGYTPASVAATGSVTSALAADTGGSDGFTFDAYGNIWVTGGTTADPPVARYPASAFTTDGTKTPDVVIDSPSFAGGFPGPKVLAFDALGNLWVSVVTAGKVVKFSPDQFDTTGAHGPCRTERHPRPLGHRLRLRRQHVGGRQRRLDGGRIDAGHLSASGSERI